MEPLVSLTEIDEFVFDTVRPVLIEYFVYRPGESFRVRVRTLLIVIQEYTGVIMSVVQRFEVLRIVRDQNGRVVGTPL